MPWEFRPTVCRSNPFLFVPHSLLVTGPAPQSPSSWCAPALMAPVCWWAATARAQTAMASAAATTPNSPPSQPCRCVEI
jgi:hypothetical protein